MVLRVSRFIRSFPTIVDFDQLRQKEVKKKVDYSQYGLAPGIYSLMREQIKLGTTMDVIAAKRKGLADFEINRDIRVYRMKKPYPLTSVLMLKKLDTTFGCDIVHAHATSGLLYSFWKRFLKKPFIVHVHGTTAGVINALEPFPDPLKNRLAMMFWNRVSLERQRFIWTRADKLLAVGSNVRNELIHLYKVSPNKIHIVHNGVDIEFFKPVDEKLKLNVRKSLKIFGEPVILFAGHLGFRKGLYYLLKAIPKVVKKYPHVLFMIIGGTPKFIGKMDYLGVWDNIVRHLGIQKNVAFVGEIKHTNIVKYYAASDLFVLPTLYEGLAKVILEAMACGLPVLTTRAGGNSDVIINGENGVLVRPGDSISFADSLLTLLSDESYTKEMGRKARDTIEKNFTWKNTAEKIMKIYEQNLNR